jgi:hypothetical protein
MEAILNAAQRGALADPLRAILIASAVTTFFWAWIALNGRPARSSGPRGAHYVAWLEVRSNNFEHVLNLYADPAFSDGGEEARHVLQLMNDDRS